jgi:hypothetical protein
MKQSIIKDIYHRPLSLEEVLFLKKHWVDKDILKCYVLKNYNLKLVCHDMSDTIEDITKVYQHPLLGIGPFTPLFYVNEEEFDNFMKQYEK